MGILPPSSEHHWVKPSPRWPLWYHPFWLSQAEADQLLATLDATLPWEQSHLTLFGKRHPIPRHQVWMGDQGLDYRYSNQDFSPEPWTPELDALRLRLDRSVALLAEAEGFTPPPSFNSVLVNRYSDGRHRMGWHQDNEPELGKDPIIASISLGATRDMRFRPTRKDQEASTSTAFNLPLEHASLLLMGPGSQSRLAHSIPERRHAAARINLTFRTLFRQH